MDSHDRRVYTPRAGDVAVGPTFPFDSCSTVSDTLARVLKQLGPARARAVDGGDELMEDAMIRFDHIGIGARDVCASAGALAAILGAAEPAVDGANGDMRRVDLDHGASLLFGPTATVSPMHVAFRVDEARFAGIVARLGERGLPFGNAVHDLRNGRTDDPLGGAGRVYFVDENGHLFEVIR